MQFTVDFQADHLVSIMEAVRREIATPQEMLTSIGKLLFKVNQERHDQGLDPDGAPWKPLSPSTLAQGDRKGGPLNKTGHMLQSFHNQVVGNELVLSFDGSRDAMLAAIHHGGTGPYVITPVKYKALNIGGVYRKRVNHPGLPARRLVGFPESDRTLVGEVIKDHLTAVLNRVR